MDEQPQRHPESETVDIAAEKPQVQGETMARSSESIISDSNMKISKPESIASKSTDSEPIYKNSLLLAIGFLDLTNALDFPANVWNQVPIPAYAKALMDLGGSIALLAITVAIWDMVRCHRNITFLRRERAHLLQIHRKGLVEKAWLAVNTRELCWEIIDRFLLDLSMSVTGIFVGIGTLLAIHGSNPTIFLTSNIMSGYLGNSFLAFYALVNVVWSGIMWRRAHRNEAAARRAKGLNERVRVLMRRHAWKHQVYAVVNGTALVVSGVASLVSATMWEGYVVQVPCVVASVCLVCFWRCGLGYDRLSFQGRRKAGEMDLGRRMRDIVDVRSALSAKDGEERDFWEILSGYGEDGHNAVLDFLHDIGLSEAIKARLTGSRESRTSSQDEEKVTTASHTTEAINSCIDSAGLKRFNYEERFLLELYGYYLREVELAHSNGIP